MDDLTELLKSWSEGDDEAFDSLAPLIYDELHRLARSYMRREADGHTIQTTALIHEAYLKLIKSKRIEWQNRAHFFGIMARIMRQVLVELARERGRRKHGGNVQRVPLEDVSSSLLLDEDLLAIDEALEALAIEDERKAKVVEMRFFGGLTDDETAAALGVSPETVRRDWRLSRSWLRRQLTLRNEDGE